MKRARISFYVNLQLERHDGFARMLNCRSFDFASIQLSEVLLGRNRRYVTHTFSSNRADTLCKCVETQISHAGKVNFKKVKATL